LFSAERSAATQPLFSSYTSRACLHQTSSTSSSGAQKFHATPSDIPPPPATAAATPSSAFAAAAEAPILPSEQDQTTIAGSVSEAQSPTAAEAELLIDGIPRSKFPVPPVFTSKLQITKTLAEKLPYLHSQRPHYISAHLHDRPYLLTEGDHLRLPFLMPKVKSGDVLRFNRASIIGSREFTLKGTPYIDERMFECRMRVLGIESEPLRVKEKTKRRQRHTRHVKSKHRYTVMRVMDVKVKSLDQLLEEGAEVIEDDSIAAAVDKDAIETKS
jgi:hypothetical protein